MSDIANLHRLVKALTDAEAEEAGIMDLGTLSDILAGLPADTPVRTEAGRPIDNLTSYRGYYDRLALCPGGDYAASTCVVADDYYGVGAIALSASTAGELRAALDLADGARMKGYKGGLYYMGGGTYLHIAPWGSCGLSLVGTQMVDGTLVLIGASDD